MNRSWYLFVLLIITCSGLFAQGHGDHNTCEKAAPFCTGTLYSFPAGVNAGTGQTGPFYSCLVTRPNPAWYYMKVGNPGNLIIKMHSDPPVDIDFCCWGPFTSQDCCGLLTQPKVVDCSYSTSAFEQCQIPSGQTGQYYMLMITNYSNNPCDIVFQQTGGSGTTDCSILPPPCTSNSPVCSGQPLQLSAQALTGATYHWWGPEGFTSQLQNPIIDNATPANSGTYYLSVEVGGIASIDTSITVVQVYYPQANAGNDTAILNGVSTTLHGSCVDGSGNYHYKWAPSALLVNDSIQNPKTVNLFASQIFTVSVTDDTANCIATDMVTINITGGALAVNAFANPYSICFGETSQIQALGSGGAENYTYQWIGPDGFSSTLQNPTVAPTITTTYHVSAFDGYNSVTGSVTVTVIPLPVSDAGQSQSIPYGTYTYLDGSVVNGNSNYFYSWLPSNQLVNSGVQNPQTVNLTATTVYSLITTDLATNCVSNNVASVSIEVTGGPLNVNPVATPFSICRGDSACLHASAGGGNVGHYQYSWSSIPPGWNSNDPDPWVKPLSSATYQITVTDQFNTTVGSTAINIYPQPVIQIGPPDTTICTYQIIKLNAGNPGSAFLWSNGSTEQQISSETSGIGYDSQVYSVEVTNENGCKSIGSIRVIFSYDICTGIDNMRHAGYFRIFPNPARNFTRIESNGISGITQGTLFSLLGQELRSFTLQKQADALSSVNLDLSGFPKGIYLVRFNNPSETQIHKLVIE